MANLVRRWHTLPEALPWRGKTPFQIGDVLNGATAWPDFRFGFRIPSTPGVCWLVSWVMFRVASWWCLARLPQQFPGLAKPI